jgi:hypothetical protein
MCLQHGHIGGGVVEAAGFTPVETLSEDLRAHATVLGHVAVFAIGATSGLQVANFTATVLSVVCLLLVPAFLLMTHRGVDLVPLVLAALGWISFLASCLLNGVSVLWENAVAPAAFSLYFIGLTVLTGRTVDRIATVLAGISAGTVVFFLTKGIGLSNTGGFLNLWKYGIAHAVTILILFALTMVRAPVLVHSLVLAVLGLASLGLNFRSHALVCLLASAIMFSHRFLGSRIRRGWQFAGIIAFGLLFAYVLPTAARAGLFGSALQSKEIEQEGTNLPILMAGRTEPPETITAIMQHPLLGWGSALKLTPDFYAQAEHLAVRMGYAPTFPFEAYWRIPADDYSAMHSVLLGSWAEGGVLAVLLPAWLLVACIGVVWNNTRFGIWAPLAVMVALQGIWDLLFNPWLYNMPAEFACIALLYGAVHFRARPEGP